MPGPADDTLKQLVERSPTDWVVRGGWPAASAAIIDADIATISGASDKVIRVTGPRIGFWPLISRPGMTHWPNCLIYCCIIASCTSDTSDAAPRVAAELWAATFILMGVRYERTLIQRVMGEVQAMEESVTYQMILEQGETRGEVKEARKMLLLLGRRKLGEPSPEVQNALNDISDSRRLEELAVQLENASSWQQLIGLGAQKESKRRRPKK